MINQVFFNFYILYHIITLQEKSVGFMQEAVFLTKLYEIKPFKIVESPQNPKRMPETISNTQNSFPSYHPITTISSLQVPNPYLQMTSKPTLYSQKQDYGINSTPNKNNKIQIQLRGSNQKSSDRFVRKYSIQQPCSPIMSNNLQKCYSISQNPGNMVNTVAGSPIKTPNKQNIFPVGTMIQSHLYTSLSSSIDTLFTKIQKIKQEFQSSNTLEGFDPMSVQNNRNSKKKGQQRKQTKGCLDGEYKMISKQNCSQIGGYSPILKSKMSKQNEISSMSSFSPILGKKGDKNILQLNKQQNKSYGKNKNFINNIYKQNFPHDGKSIQLFEPMIVGLPATHTQNIHEMSNKTKSIIDQINLLLESNKKNNAYFEKQKIQNCKAAYPQNLRKINTLQIQSLGCNEHNDYLQYLNKKNQRQNAPCHQYDELDDEFITIKLKPMQSQYAPQTFHKTNSANNSVNSCEQNKKKGNCPKLQTKISNINFNYKIEQPNFINQNPKDQVRNAISQYLSDSQEINHDGIQLSMRDFQLGKCVGSGKFGDVHICKHKVTGFIFALKKVFKSTIIQYGMINQFIQELKIHYALSNNHPNITKLYTHFQDQYHIFLIMEYIQDGTLMNHLKKSQEFVSNIVLQVLNAVEYLHRHSIAHRDIKPENILYTNGVVKICDFGWSSLCKDEMKKTFCGTLDYVSPQMKDRGQYTTTVDLWSIGVLTFQLLTGFAPYKKQIDKWRIMGSKLQDRWRWDVIFPPQISNSARKFMQKLLKQNPDERISIRECRQQEFITKFNRKQCQYSLITEKQLYKIL